MISRSDAEVLFANERFYNAFAQGDGAEMNGIWGREGAVTCLHPGWEPLLKRHDIIASWTAILAEPPGICCHSPTVVMLGQHGASVLCWEEIQRTYMLATNVFRREADGWKIVHHQACPTSGTPPKVAAHSSASKSVN